LVPLRAPTVRDVADSGEVQPTATGVSRRRKWLKRGAVAAVVVVLLLSSSYVITGGFGPGMTGIGVAAGGLIAERFAWRRDSPSRWRAGPPSERWH
jgi:hypothetical protein